MGYRGEPEEDSKYVPSIGGGKSFKLELDDGDKSNDFF